MKKKKKRKKTKRFTRITKHHLTPRCRGGANTFQNLLALNEKRHEAWHILFGVLTLDEVIAVLQRLKKAKDEIETPFG
jgi:hypothetical protein